MLAEVDHRVGAELPLQPAVGGQVVVRRRKIGVVVDRDRVLAEAARRLDQDHHVAGLQRGRDDLAVGDPGCRSTNSSPGAAPQASVIARTRSAGSSPSQRR